MLHHIKREHHYHRLYEDGTMLHMVCMPEEGHYLLNLLPHENISKAQRQYGGLLDNITEEEFNRKLEIVKAALRI